MGDEWSAKQDLACRAYELDLALANRRLDFLPVRIKTSSAQRPNAGRWIPSTPFLVTRVGFLDNDQ